MDVYVSLAHFWDGLEIEHGDIVFISSDIKRLLFLAMRTEGKIDINVLIDGLIDRVGPNGTIIFPTYNWGFCSGEPFDYRNTPSKTGTLSNAALKRCDFCRTRHPIYSFAVWGKYQDQLCSMDNIDSFGLDSPFAFLKEHNAKNYVIDVPLQHCFTFAHYVEEHSGSVSYRYLKNFISSYIDENGMREERSYSMFVRDLEMNVQVTIDPIEKDLVNSGFEKKYCVNGIEIKCIRLGDAYDVLLKDIIDNRARKLCTYIGQ